MGTDAWVITEGNSINDSTPPRLSASAKIESLSRNDFASSLAAKKGYTLVPILYLPENFVVSCMLLLNKLKKIQKELKVLQKARGWIAQNPEETTRKMIDKKYISSDDPAFMAQF